MPEADAVRYYLTDHARARMQGRAIPEHAVRAVLRLGWVHPAGDGLESWTLDYTVIRGHPELAPWRRLVVVTCPENKSIVTVAWRQNVHRAFVSSPQPTLAQRRAMGRRREAS
jgi:hypothetical protein